MTYVLIYLGVLVLMSFITFLTFKKDKKSAGNERNPRVPEIVLLSLSTFGGALGGMAGMYGLRHKTDFKTKFHFAIVIHLSALVQVLILALLLWAKGGIV